MGKRILIPSLIALLFAAGVGAWFALGPERLKGRGGTAGDLCSNSAHVIGRGEACLAPTQDDRDVSAQACSSDTRGGTRAEGSRAAEPSGGRIGGAAGPDVPSSDSPGAASGGSRPDSPAPNQSAGKPAHSKERIIDAPRPPNQTLGNAKPRSRVLATGPAKKLEDVSEKLKQDRRGLYAQYYAFTSDPLAELAKEDAKPLAQRDAALVRIDNQVHFPNNEAFADLPFDLANFAAAWDGYLVIPEQGEYWLFLGADNAARVDLDGETVLLNDVQSRYIEVSTVLELAPGLHPLHIEFAQGILANEDSWRCAASFMWVPKGQQKPVPVPPEMLMVPAWMWSDDAPILTSVEKNESEVGDVIAIHGSGFVSADLIANDFQSWNKHTKTKVLFNGQQAEVNGVGRQSPRGRQFLDVKVPIGASTGKLNVLRFLSVEITSGQSVERWIPSNSIDFKVTTQFGLLAQWYKLGEHAGASIPDFSALTPELSRIEHNIVFDDRERLDLPFKNEPLACRWEGFVGLPASELVREFWVHSHASTLRLKVGEQTDESEEAWPVDCMFSLVVRIEAGDELRLPIVIEWVNPWGIEGNCSFDFNLALIAKEEIGKPSAPSTRVLDKCYRFLFPPVTPPKPPRIASVIPMTIAGDEPPTPPFFATPGLISVREGQQFKCNVEIFGDEEVRAAPITLFVDGHAIECGSGTLIDDSANKRWFRQFVGVLPAGCGEGKLTAKLGLSVSEPFYIDVANKGLIAYVYDLPDPSGYSQFPNILPLTCHTIRKEREINFGTAVSFNLPFVAETFAVEWYGAIIIEADGWYTFTSRTDDGCSVWLNGIEIIDDDNLHAPQEKSSERIRLVAGTYPFRMQFFENNQHEECLLFVSATDMQEKEMLAKQVVPKRMFTWEVHDTLPDKIATGKKADGSD